VNSSSGVATSVSELLYPCYFTLLTLLTVQPVATCRQSPYVHKPVVVTCCYLFTVLNSGLLFYSKRESTTPTTPCSQPLPLPSRSH